MSAIQKVLEFYTKLDALEGASNLMGWDMQTIMPAGGATVRGQHLGILTSLRHEILISDEYGEAIEAAQAEAESAEDLAMLREVRSERERATKLPLSLVRRKSEVSSKAYQMWRVAKPANDFASMVPFYTELFEIAAETSQLLGQGGHLYDSLINMYEEGATYAEAAQMFQAIKQPIVDLVAAIRDRGAKNDDSPLHQDWDQEALRATVQTFADKIGYDFNRGRLDLAANAFCSNPGGRADVRMTTRPSGHIKGVLSSSLHEMGHGLYEQGSPEAWQSTPLAGGISLAVHESQSRLWENVVGRSMGFWRHFFPALATRFPEVFGGLADADFFRMINKVEPSFVRVGADELTYNLHILIRFELEVELITKSLEIKDLPEAWNEKYESYLGIRPSTNTEGCLQDVHWSRGSVGYFPTYSMGNLIGLQLWDKLKEEIGEQEENFARGDFAPTLGWLTEKVYSQGRLHLPKDLLLRTTGKKLDPNHWLNYAVTKYTEIYQL